MENGSEKVNFFPSLVKVSPGNAPLALERQEVEPLVVPQSSPTRERSPDVISSASTAMSQDIPEIASETLQRSFGGGPPGLPAEMLDSNHHADSMASAASALHLLSPRNRHSSEHSHHSLDMAPNEVDMLTAPSLLEAALPQENVASDAGVSQPWPAAPDITRETRNSMADRYLLSPPFLLGKHQSWPSRCFWSPLSIIHSQHSQWLWMLGVVVQQDDVQGHKFPTADMGHHMS